MKAGTLQFKFNSKKPKNHRFDSDLSINHRDLSYTVPSLPQQLNLDAASKSSQNILHDNLDFIVPKFNESINDIDKDLDFDNLTISPLNMADLDRDTVVRIFPLSEVWRHNKQNDCWIVVGNNIYDVTRFLQEHPGGESVLLAKGGRDATKVFEDQVHSARAKAMLKKYQIGTLDVHREEDTASNSEAETLGNNHVFPIVLAGIIIIVLIYIYMQNN